MYIHHSHPVHEKEEYLSKRETKLCKTIKINIFISAIVYLRISRWMCQSWVPTNGNHANLTIHRWYLFCKLDMDFSKCVARKELNYMSEREREKFYVAKITISYYQILEWSIDNKYICSKWSFKKHVDCWVHNLNNILY